MASQVRRIDSFDRPENVAIAVDDPDQSRLGRAVGLLDAWLDTMRGPRGYGGPVVHWWGDCLHFTGAGLDWRYEGIISGYLHLYEGTGQEIWLSKARRAGDDLVSGQSPAGNYSNSSFELNPSPCGTPHEAACDLGLLLLAKAVKKRNSADTKASVSQDTNGLKKYGNGDEGALQRQEREWRAYLETAERNLENFILASLWDDGEGYFKNSIHDPAFVPNKAATIVEALLLWMAFTDRNSLLEEFIIPTLDRILDCQVRSPGHRLDGAIDQACRGGKLSGRYFPFYIARCIPALISGYRATGQQRYLYAACQAADFLIRERLADGSWPQVIYSNGRVNPAPRWIAPTGDLLRGLALVGQYGKVPSHSPTLEWLLGAQFPTGGLPTARGFTDRGIVHNYSQVPEFRDLLPVCGWVDKAFRYLTSCLPAGCSIEPATLEDLELACSFRGKIAQYRENRASIQLWQGKELIYRWQKGSPWAEACAV